MPSISGIYEIRNTINGNCYIGSAVNLEKRTKDHIYHLGKGNHANNHLQKAWNKYGKSSFIVSIIEYCDKEFLLSREQFYLEKMNPEYNIAKNSSSPMLGVKHTDEARMKIRLAGIGRLFSKETRDKISASQKGIPKKPHTQEFKDKMRILFKGRAISDEQKKQASEYRKGKCFMTDEGRKRISEKMKGNKFNVGYKHSDTAKKNMSFAHLGKSITDEQKNKISQALKGHIVTDEVKEKIRISNTGLRRTQDTKTRISESKKGLKETDEHKKKIGEGVRNFWKNKKNE